MLDSHKYEKAQRGDVTDVTEREISSVPTTTIHWWNPALMITTLVAGIAMAATHHAYYQSLDDAVVHSASQQTWNIRIGTGIAFLTKVFLTSAVSVACVQNLWLLLYRKPIAMGTIDSLYGLLNNPLNFLQISAWLRGPIVIFLAIIAWLLPFAAIVTPSTLTVHQVVVSTSHLAQIQPVNWSSSEMSDTSSFGRYDGPTTDIRRIAMAVGTGASILNIPPQYPNSSYTLDFWAPALSCKAANSTVYESIRSVSNGTNFSFFVGFVPALASNMTESFKSVFRVSGTSAYSYSTLDRVSEDYARIYLVAYETDTGANYNLSVTECGLRNSSYTVDFEFENGVQKVTVQNRTDLGGFPFFNIDNASFNQTTGLLFNYNAMMDTFGRMFVGYAGNTVSGGTNQRATSLLLTAVANSQELKPFQYTAQNTASKELGSGKNFTLAEGAEEYFTNFTLSLLSSNTYLASLQATAETNITTFGPQNRYTYAAKNLWISYGIASGFAILGVALGISAFLQNSASFSNSFSSVLRVTRNPELSTIVQPERTTGSEPLRKDLANVKISMQQLVSDDGHRYWSMAAVKKDSSIMTP